MTYEDAHAAIRSVFDSEPNARLIGPLVGALLSVLVVKGTLTLEDVKALRDESERLQEEEGRA